MALMMSSMTFRDLMEEYGIHRQKDVVLRTAMSKQQVWMLWHGKVNVGRELAERLSAQLNIPLARLTTLDRYLRPRARRPGRPRKERPA